MKSKYQCPYCQYMSSRKWNVQNHVRNVHRIKDFSNGSSKKPNINQQNIRPKEYVVLNFPNGSNEKPQIYQQKKFHTKSECENQSENKVLRCLCEPSQPCHADVLIKLFVERKTNDIKQEFGIEMDKYEKYEPSVDLTADE